MSYYIHSNDQQTGPFSLEEIQAQFSGGRIPADALVWAEGMPDWVSVSTFLKPTESPSSSPGSDALTKESASSGISSSPAPRVKPPNYLIHAFIPTVVFFNPLGIVAILFASQVNSKFAAGDFVGAEEASKKAKQWFYIALISGFFIEAAVTMFCILHFFLGVI